jgi:hypothetical protein
MEEDTPRVPKWSPWTAMSISARLLPGAASAASLTRRSPASIGARHRGKLTTGGTPDLSGAKSYRNGASYKAGDLVIADDQEYYYCRVPNWCGKAAYAPDSSNGPMAWGKF